MFPNTFATFAKFFLKSLFATWSYRYPGTIHVIQRALELPSVSHTCFSIRQIFAKFFPWSQLLSRNLAKTLQVLVRDILFPCWDRVISHGQEKLRTGEGVCKDLSCQKTFGRWMELERAVDNDMITLRKAIREKKNFAKVTKILWLSQKYSKTSSAKL